MTATTDQLYRNLTDTEASASITVTKSAGWIVQTTAAELLASMRPVAASLPSLPEPATYISQWATEANTRRNDCGPTCGCMFLRARGIPVQVNQLTTADPTGLTSGEQVQAILKTYGVDSVVEHLPADCNMSEVPPYSILLVNYTPLAKYSWDTHFTGPDAWHWLIFVGLDPNDSQQAITLDPDYGGDRMADGNHKRYPTEAMRVAFRPYGSGTTTTSVRVLPTPLPSTPPLPLPNRKVQITANSLNMRSGPGITYAILGQIRLDSIATVVEEQDGWLRISGFPDKRWISAAYTKPAPSTPPVTTPPMQTLGGWGDHFLGAQPVPSSYIRLIAKAVDQPELLSRLYAINPNGTYTFRHWLSTDEQNRRMQLMQTDMQAALDQWFAETEQFLPKLPPGTLIESLNEVDGPAHYLEFERQRAKLMRERYQGKFRPLVLNISVARATQDMFTQAAPMIQEVIAAGGAVGVHCYGMGIISNNAGGSFVRADGTWQGDLFPTLTPADWDQCHTGLSILKYKKWLIGQGQGNAVLIATELGLGNTAGEGRPGLLNKVTEGWRDCIPLWQQLGWLNGTTPEAFYRKGLDWWAEQTGCLGTVYTRGTGGDHQWDVDDTSGAW